MKYRLKHVVEYIALCVVAGVVRILPYRAALLLGWLLALISFHLFRFRRKEAEWRIRQVFGDSLSKRCIGKIAWESWRNVVFDGIEMLLMPRMTLKWIRSVAGCEPGIPTIKKHSDTGRGGIIACPHMGSWELAGVACHLHGIPIFSLAAQQKNPLTDRFMNHLRTSPGIVTIARGSGAMKEIIKMLKKGGMLAILPDVRMRTEGVKVAFLGGTVNAGVGMALFARRADVPIFPCIVTRRGWCRHHFEVLDPVQPDKSLGNHEDIERMTGIVLKAVDSAIRRDPGQWFWFNKRWILDPIT
jgi:Kdo2-lipid IVA lauroyltransferase/acyltransferase